MKDTLIELLDSQLFEMQLHHWDKGDAANNTVTGRRKKVYDRTVAMYKETALCDNHIKNARYRYRQERPSEMLLNFPAKACIAEMEENYQAYMSQGATVSASVMNLAKGIVQYHAENSQPKRESSVVYALRDAKSVLEHIYPLVKAAGVPPMARKVGVMSSIAASGAHQIKGVLLRLEAEINDIEDGRSA